MLKHIGIAILTLTLPGCATIGTEADRQFHGEPFVRTELFFGFDMPDGLAVAPEDFQTFLDAVVTPRFPDGLTLLPGTGQYRGADGEITKESSAVLILLYPKGQRKRCGQKIDEIRQAYKTAYRQESVMRSDYCCEEVGF